MYPAGHIVVATGAAWGAERIARRLLRRDPADATRIERAADTAQSLFDYRLVALGAWLPDITDKPLGWWILGDPAYEHSFAHSLLFVWVLTLPGLFLARRGDRRLLSIAFGVAMHALCDPVMRAPEVFFWPLYGWSFNVRLGYALDVPIDLLRWDPVFAALGAVVLLRLWHIDRLRGLVLCGRL
jgi:LexA-binding, inner membrane-associated putative hydrolase